MVDQVDSAVAEIASNPDVGEKKKGALSDCGLISFGVRGNIILLVTPEMMGFDWYGWRV
jgi:hypothetical protein